MREVCLKKKPAINCHGLPNHIRTSDYVTTLQHGSNLCRILIIIIIVVLVILAVIIFVILTIDTSEGPVIILVVGT